MYLSLYCKGSKRLFKVLWWKGVGDRTELQYIDPHSYGRQRYVFLVLQGCSTRGLGAHSAGFLYHILSATSLDPNSIRAPRAPSAWCGFPHHISSLPPTVWLFVLTELCNSSTPTQSNRPLNRSLNLWNGMFDRHQADFLPCPISLAKHAYAISSHNCHWNISLPSGASPWNGKFGRVEGQNTTIEGPHQKSDPISCLVITSPIWLSTPYCLTC